jgi:hypothetical protein
MRYIAANVPTRGGGRRQARDERRAKIAQKQEDHEDDEADRESQLEFDIAARGSDGRGAIVQHRDIDTRRHCRLQRRKGFLDGVHDRDDIGAGLALNIEDDGRRGHYTRRRESCSRQT